MTTMSTYTQFGYPYAPASQLLMSTSSGSTSSAGGSASSSSGSIIGSGSPLGSSGSGGSGSAGGSTGSGAASPCCDSGRPLVSDPVTGQTVCSCQYDRLQALSAYGSAAAARLAAVSSGVYGAAYPSTEQNPYPSLSMDSTAFYSSLANPYTLKDGSATSDMGAWSAGAGLQAAPGYYPYDPTFAAYGYGAGYDLAARRKNATRESTATLKAWLSEHKKNPYPTKGEKIMLAIITKMTLTQVSTWFANARRRLKKENKMTWEPKNRNDDDDDDDCSATSDDEGKMMNKDLIKDEDHHDKDGDDDKSETDNDSRGPLSPRSVNGVHHGGPGDVSTLNACQVSSSSASAEASAPGSVKPKIWSLADTAACKTPPPPSAIPSGTGALTAGAPHSWFAGVGSAVNPMVSMATMAPVGHVAGNNVASMASMSKMGFGPYRYAGFPGYGSYPSTSGSAYGLMGNSCGPYAEVQTDTPPQTPPNLKMTSMNGILGHQQYVSPSSLSRATGNPMGPVNQEHQTEMLSPVPRGLLGSSAAATNGALAQAVPAQADPSSTAFRPVYRTSPVNGGYVSSS